VTRQQRESAMAEALEHVGNVPPDIVKTLEQYVVDGRPTGEFLVAVLSNDLVEAVTRADADNLAALLPIVQFVYCNLPAACWGRSQIVADWIAAIQSHEMEAQP